MKIKKTAKILALSVVSVFIAGVMLYAAPQKYCPVMGDEINKNIYVDFNGKRIYFCCTGCPEEFKKNPGKYMEKMKKEGVELENTPAKK